MQDEGRKTVEGKEREKDDGRGERKVKKKGKAGERERERIEGRRWKRKE